MKLNKYLTPFPVLSLVNSDYVDSTFSANVVSKTAFGIINLSIDYSLDDEGLQKLINDGYAEFVTHVECPMLGYRAMAQSSRPAVNIKIDENEVASKSDISTFIIAIKDITGYHNDRFSWDYGENATFDIPKGSFLAIGPTFCLKTDRDDKDFSKITDIFSILEDDSNPDYCSIDLEGDCIQVRTNANIKNRYYNYTKSEKYTWISMIFLPALTEALRKMHDNQEVYQDYKWFEVLQRLLEANSLSIDDLSDETSDKNYFGAVAQKIFKSPIEKALNERQSVSEE